jgi:hypothetical protein
MIAKNGYPNHFGNISNRVGKKMLIAHTINAKWSALLIAISYGAVQSIM